MDESVYGFQACWLSHFLDPVSIQGDRNFAKGSFSENPKGLDVHFRIAFSSRHRKKSLENKRGMIRDTFLKLQTASRDTDTNLLAVRAVAISNDLYVNDVL